MRQNCHIQRLATFGNVPIPDITIFTLTLAMFELTGLLATTTEKFCLRPIDKRTVPLFKSEFHLGNKERLRRLTANDAGFHGAYSVVRTPLAVPVVATAVVTPLHPTPPPAARNVTVEGGKMYFCWTHGLSPQRTHTSLTCLHKADGHRDDVPAIRMRGGNNTISSGRPRQLPSSDN